MLLFLLAACGAPTLDDSALRDTGAPGTGDTVTAVTVRRVGWHVAWDDAGVAFGDAGWTTTRKDGVEITVQRGYASLYAASLVECPQAASAGERMLDAALGVALGRAAWAGHGEGSDVSTLPRPVVEDLADPVDADLDELTFSTNRYCQVHHVAAAATALGVGLPEEVDMTGRSLFLAGTWRAPGEEVAAPFTLESDASWGELADLAAVGPAGAGDRVDVTLTRSLAGLFDDVALDGDSDEAAAQVLRNLVEDAVVDVVLSET
jgi:hypothetical protein